MPTLTKYVFLALLLIGCESEDLGTTPPSKPLPFSRQSRCFDGTAYGAPIDAGTFFPSIASALPLTTFSFSAWVRMTKPDAAIGGSIAGTDADPLQMFELHWLDGTPVVELSVIVSGTASAVNVSVSNPRQWNHFVFTFDGYNPVPADRLVLYFNGARVADADVAVEMMFAPGRSFAISQQANPLLNGCVDEASAWHRKLSDAEVSLLYNEGEPNDITTILPDVASWWRVEEADAPSTLSDSAGSFDQPIVGSLLPLSNILDPFTNATTDGDPLNEGAAGDKQEPGSGGAGVFEGGTGGFGGDFGDGGTAGKTPFP